MNNTSWKDIVILVSLERGQQSFRKWWLHIMYVTVQGKATKVRDSKYLHNLQLIQKNI